MADRPTLFSGLMVNALLDGRKTTTRRIIKPRGKKLSLFDGTWSDSYVLDPGNEDWRKRDIPYAIGDRLWVKETWAPLEALDHSDPGTQALIDRGFFRADGSVHDDDIDRWRPSIYMPRARSRITLIVTDVKVERLHEITEQDARAEGAYRGKASGRYADSYVAMAIKGEWFATARGWYRDLWNRINPKCPWDANPWVVAPTFAVVKTNIDKLITREADA